MWIEMEGREENEENLKMQENTMMMALENLWDDQIRKAKEEDEVQENIKWNREKKTKIFFFLNKFAMQTKRKISIWEIWIYVWKPN